MKKYSLYIIGAIGLILGFSIAWSIKGSDAFSNSETADPSSTMVTSSTEEVVFTCSMHPQIRQPEPGQCPICRMDLIPANSALNGSNEFGFQMTDEAVQLANIQTYIVGNGPSNEGTAMILNGKIKADETQAASLVSHIPGRIENLHVSFKGEQVKKGQKIATIYSPELITAQRELLEAQKMTDMNPGFLNAAKNKLKYWKIDSQIIDGILESGIVKESFDIHADQTGIVSERKVSVGDYISIGEVLFDVQNLNRLWALFDVYESDLPKLKTGRLITFSTPSIPTRTFHAKITFIDPVINPRTRVATVRVELDNASGKLKPEMFVTGKINIGSSNKHLSLPKTAVLWTGQRSVVYVKNPDAEIPTFEYREIELGESSGSAYEVISGLEAGEEVVTNGAFVIDASAQLNNHNSMMNKNVIAKNAAHKTHLPDYQSTTPSAFKDQLSKVAFAYFPLKDALVASDAEEAITKAKSVLEAVEEVDMSLLKGQAHNYWMEQVKALQAHGTKITTLNEIDAQRTQFEFFSQSIIKSLKVFGVADDTFYVQYCPMANDNKGAAWLSLQSNILNPYFGEKMLTCGFIEDTLDENFRNPEMQNQSNTIQNTHNH